MGGLCLPNSALRFKVKQVWAFGNILFWQAWLGFQSPTVKRGQTTDAFAPSEGIGKVQAGLAVLKHTILQTQKRGHKPRFCVLSVPQPEFPYLWLKHLYRHGNLPSAQATLQCRGRQVATKIRQRVVAALGRVFGWHIWCMAGLPQHRKRRACHGGFALFFDTIFCDDAVAQPHRLPARPVPVPEPDKPRGNPALGRQIPSPTHRTTLPRSATSVHR